MDEKSRSEASMGRSGNLTTEKPCYQPLDVVRVTIHGRDAGDTQCTLRVCDPQQKTYLEKQVALKNNRGEATFLAGGSLGVHYIYLLWPGEKRHSRYLNFWLDCETTVESGDEDIDFIYPFTRDRMRLGRREYDTPQGKFVGYMSADTWHFDGIWLRDWIYGLPGYKYWERDMACGIDRFLEQQAENGMIPDGIERSGKTWRVGLESDVEYIMVMGAWGTWKATGDDAWLVSILPKLEKALEYVRSDPKHWDESHRLIKRQHSCDTWDFDIDSAGDSGKQRHVVATCDQSGYVLAFQALSQMYGRVGCCPDAHRWEREAEEYRKRANQMLWDGVKFQHHVHLDAIDHNGFDESQQLAMGNTWAMTRGLATRVQAQSIIDEYKRRHEQTGDAYPWWSLQPGYPDELGYFGSAHRKQGGYANGGLMPWVGGELCRAAFRFGREKYGVELMRQYVDHLRRTGGAHVWYWPDGEPGFRTTNEVPYAGWGMAQWVEALFEGLAGVEDRSCLMEQVRLNPQWFACGVKSVLVRTRYAPSRGYFAYRMTTKKKPRSVVLDYSGSGRSVAFQIPVPDDWTPKTVTVNGESVEFSLSPDSPNRVCFSVEMQSIGKATVLCD